jgi:hypothetical protein
MDEIIGEIMDKVIDKVMDEEKGGDKKKPLILSIS